MTTPSTTPLYAQTFFQRVAGRTWRPGGIELTRHALALCGFAPHARVLDAGCGSGATLELLYSLGLRPVGVDIQPVLPDVISTGSGAAQSFSMQKTTLCARLDALPFAKASFDGIVCECVLSLMADPNAAMREFARLLPVGGKLLISDVYLRSPAPVPTNVSSASRSCLQGARAQVEIEKLFATNNFILQYVEDHSHTLAILAAQLAWYGDTRKTAHGISCSDASNRAKHGYGIWIATKNMLA